MRNCDIIRELRSSPLAYGNCFATALGESTDKNVSTELPVRDCNLDDVSVKVAIVSYEEYKSTAYVADEPYLTMRADATESRCSYVHSAEQVCDEYGNYYILLFCNEQRAGAMTPKTFYEELSMQPIGMEVYAQVPCESEARAKSDGFVKIVSVDATSSPVSPPIMVGVIADEIPVNDNDESLLISSNIIQNISFTAIGFLIAAFIALPTRADIGLALFEVLPQQILLLVCMILGTIVLAGASAAMSGLQKLMSSKEAHEVRQKSMRQSIVGEVIQLPTWSQATFFAFTGVGEEALFRAGLIPAFYAPLSFLVEDPVISVVLASLCANIVFTACHIGTYRDVMSILAVFVLGVLLTILFFVSGSIVAGSVAHAIYDFAVVALQKKKMDKIGYAEFFYGRRPVEIVRDKNEGYVFARDNHSGQAR